MAAIFFTFLSHHCSVGHSRLWYRAAIGPGNPMDPMGMGANPPGGLGGDQVVSILDREQISQNKQ